MDIALLIKDPSNKQNKSFLLIILFAIALVSSDALGQTITVSSVTGGVSASPLMGGTTNHAILGLQVDKAGGGTNSVTGIVIALSQTPTGKITNPRLYRSTDNTFAGIGSETLVTTGTFVGNSIDFNAAITTFGGGSGAVTRYFFVVVDIDPNVTGSDMLQPSVDAADLDLAVATGASGSSIGFNYGFTALTTTIGDLNAGANNVATSPLTPSATGQGVFGFSLVSNGSQTVSEIRVQLSSDPSGKLTSWSLVRSTDTDFATSGDNAAVTATITPSTTQVVITGISEDVSSAKNYFLVANVAANPSGTIQATLGNTNITVNQGLIAGSATGTTYSFLSTLITNLTSGVAASPLIAGNTGQAVFGFSLASGGSQTVSVINVQLSTDPAGKLSNWSIVRSGDSDFSTSGDNTVIGSATLTPSATEVAITGLTEDVSTLKNYFLVADVNLAVTGATAAIQASLGAANVTVNVGGTSGSATGTNYAFAALTATIASLNDPGTNNVASSPLVAGTAGEAVFGFSLVSNGSQTVSQLNVQLSSTPVSKLASWSLVRSVDADFASLGDNTTIGSLTFTPSATEVVITGLTEDISTLKNYFLVATVDGTVTAATPAIQASLGSGNVTLSAGSATGSATGVNYSFIELTTTIASLNSSGSNGVATSPLIATSTGNAVFGFSLTSNGSQTVSVINVQLSSDPASKLTSFSLVKSVDNDFATSGDNSTVTATIVATTTEVQITAISEAITSTTSNYFLVANVDGSVTSGTAAIQASLGTTNVTVNAGTKAGSATGTNYSFEGVTTTIASLNAGSNNVAASPLVAGAAGQAVFGFSLTSNLSQTVTVVNVQLSSDPTGKLTTWSLVKSVDADFATTGDNSAVTATITPSATQVAITAISESITSTSSNYFLVANVDGAVTGATPTVQATLAAANVTVNAGLTAGSSAGTVYSFAPLTATFTEVTAGTAPVIAGTVLEAGTTAVVLTGFEAASNYSQELSAINFNITGLTTQFSSVYLYRSSSAGSVGSNLLTDGNGDGNFDDLSSLSLANRTIDTTPVYYYLVVDVLNTVTTATTGVTVAPTAANIAVTTGGKNALSISRSFTFTQSNDSDITLSGGNTANIVINASNTASTPGEAVVVGNSAILGTFTIREGGAGDDPDNLPTILDGLTISVENFANLDQIALFDESGVKISGTDKTPAATVNWTGLNYSTGTDNTNRNFTIRASFKTVVTDNQQTDIDIIATTSAAATGSLFAATNAGGNGTSATGSHNQTEVLATTFIFVDPNNLPSGNPAVSYTGPEYVVYTAPGPSGTFSAVVAAVDANYNIDLDAGNDGITASLNLNPASAALVGGGNAAIDNGTGLHTFSGLTIGAVGTYELEATSPQGQITTDATDAQGTSVTIVIQSAGINITPANLAMCKSDATGVYMTLPNIVLDENENADFGTGSDLSFLLILPSGWVFDTNFAGTISYTGGRNISAADASFTFLGNTIAKFLYSVSNTNKDDVITLSGLKVRNNGGFDGVITRGGTGVIKGCCDDTKPLGTLTTSPSAAVDFSVKQSPGEPVIQPTQTQFPKTSEPIILEGQVPAGNTPDGSLGFFTGSGVSNINIPEEGGNRYTFNPGILASGNYDITFSYADVNGCLSEFTKPLTVYDGAIDNLAESYCAGDITPYDIDVNPTFIPSGSYVVRETNGVVVPRGTVAPNPPSAAYLAAEETFSLKIPSYRYITEAVNNSGTMTLTVRNHGFNNGEQYWVYIANSGTSFSGLDAPYGYIYKLCTVSSATTDQFDIDVNVIGTWDKGIGYVYLPTNYFIQASNVVNNSGTSLTITAADHGFYNGARPFITIGLRDLGLGTYHYVEGFYTIENATTNTFTITVSVPTNFTTFYYGYLYADWYRFTNELVPDITLLNKRLLNVSAFEVGYFIHYDWCGTAAYCDVYYYTGNTPVQLYANPIVSFFESGDLLDPNLNVFYCEDDAAITLIGSESTSGAGTFDINPKPEGTIQNIGNGTATFIPSSQTFDVSYTIQYAYTDGNGCTGISTQPTIVRSKLAPPIVLDTAVCQYVQVSDAIYVSASSSISPVTFSWYSDPLATPPAIATGALFNTGLSTSSPSSTTEFYVTQSNPASCESDPATISVDILAQPSASFQPPNNPAPCEGNEFTIYAPTAGGTAPNNYLDGAAYDLYVWTFAEEGGFVRDSIQNDNQKSYTYEVSGVYTVGLYVMDANGCENDFSSSVAVNPNPDIVFGFADICSGRQTQFSAFPAPDPEPTDIVSYAWSFYRVDPADTVLLDQIPETPKGNTLSAPFGGTGRNPTYQFADGSGEYLVTGRSYSNLGCFSDSTKRVVILDTLIRTTSFPYEMASQDNGMGFWRVLPDNSQNSTWEYALPTTGYLGELGSASWVTNADGTYSANEYSYLNSPCFDVSGIIRPVMSIHYAMNTDRGRDGIAMEFSVDNGQTWQQLGGYNSGINWFNTPAFSTAPIGVSTQGWSGDSWINLPDNVAGDTVVFGRQAIDADPNLDSPAERTNVRFRLVFKTDNFGEYEGFGFKNLLIETRSRSLLVENFTNENDPQYAQNNTHYEAISPAEAVKMEYHVSYPTDDNSSKINPGDQSARAAYYGVTLVNETVPRTYIDAVSGGSLIGNGGNLAAWADERIGKRALVPAPFSIDIQSQPAADGYLKATLTLTALNDIPLVGEPVLHMAAVEKKGPNNAYDFVLRKFFHGANGTPMSLVTTFPITIGTVIQYTDSVYMDDPRVTHANLSIIAFIQDRWTKDIYQTGIEVDPANLPDINTIVSIEDPTYSDRILLYPNPANTFIHIELPTAVTVNTPVTLTDGYGRTVYESQFETGEYGKNVRTTEFASGVYILQVGTPGGGVARRKVSIVH